jgi:uridylate kinase
VGGTGLPYFTTDTAAALRAVEVKAQMLLKATKVDGVYDKDPVVHSDAVKYHQLTQGQMLAENLAVMDGTATALCREHELPILVFDLFAPNSLHKALFEQNFGTLVLPH